MNKFSASDTSTQSSTQRAYLELREAIITGKVPPGERLKVETLKETLQTGASPVREALSLLTSDQLVERLDQRGFRVAQASKAQFQEVLHLRCALEAIALKKGLAEASPEWEEGLVLAHHRMSRAAESKSEDFEVQHKLFHMALLSACDSPMLMRFCDQLYDLNIRYRNLAGRSKSYDRRNVAAEHRAILDAAIARDVSKTCQELDEHYRKTGAFLTELLD